MANELLSFHHKVLWTPNTGLASSKRPRCQLQIERISKRSRVETTISEATAQPLKIGPNTFRDRQQQFVPSVSHDGKDLTAPASAASAAQVGFPSQLEKRRDLPIQMPIDEQVYSGAAMLGNSEMSTNALNHPNGISSPPLLSINEFEMFQPLRTEDFVGQPLLSMEALFQSTGIGCGIPTDVPSTPRTAAASNWSVPPSSDAHEQGHTSSTMSTNTTSLRMYSSMGHGQQLVH